MSPEQRRVYSLLTEKISKATRRFNVASEEFEQIRPIAMKHAKRMSELSEIMRLASDEIVDLEQKKIKLEEI